MHRDLHINLLMHQNFIFGSKTYIVTNSELKQPLETRTTTDPRDYIGLTIFESAFPEYFDGYFVGYGNNSGVIIFWDPKTRRVKRAHHAYIDEANIKILK